MLTKNTAAVEEDHQPIECAICLENVPDDNVFFTQCDHIFHSTCWAEYTSKAPAEVQCPLCRRVEQPPVEETETLAKKTAQCLCCTLCMGLFGALAWTR